MNYESKGYRDKSTLEELYYQKDMDQKTIADVFDVSFQTISRWMRKHDIAPGIEAGQFSQKNKATFVTDGRGYERLDAYDPSQKQKEYVKVHRLLAVSEYGFDAVIDHHIHHENSIPWDNRPENIDVVEPEEHVSEHATEWAEWRERDDDGTFS